MPVASLTPRMPLKEYGAETGLTSTPRIPQNAYVIKKEYLQYYLGLQSKERAAVITSSQQFILMTLTKIIEDQMALIPNRMAAIADSQVGELESEVEQNFCNL